MGSSEGLASVSETSYKGWHALSVESERVKAVLVPGIGAKMVSLVYKPTGNEWLLDTQDSMLRRPEYGANFVDFNIGGFDDMCPTILPCEYPVDGQYKGALLPDHGETWSIPWDWTIEDERITLAVKGKALPYELAKTLWFTAPEVLRSAYRIRNLGAERMAFLWAAHPLFVVTEDTEIRLPDEIKQVVGVIGGKRLGEAGTVYDWPVAKVQGEDTMRLDRIGPASNRDSRKLYSGDVVPSGWSGLYRRASGEYLVYRVPKEKVPYLGIWIEEGEYTGRSTCALEPSTGFYDSLEWAINNEKVGYVDPGQVYDWYFDTVLGEGQETI